MKRRLREVARRYGVAAEPLQALLDALASERDPPTTVADPVYEHVADSLSVLPLLASASTSPPPPPPTSGPASRSRPAAPAPVRIADIGSGLGFPGLALAAALPACEVVLVESQRRHAAVAERLGRAAGLANVSVLPLRVEELGRVESFDLVTARAVASLAVLVEYAAPLLAPAGQLVAWKGARDAAEELGGEVAASIVGLSLERVVAVEPFPGAHSRQLHFFAKTGRTPERFPRRPGMARKRPLST